MKQLISAFLLIILAVSLIVLSFTIRQVDQEQQTLTDDLQYRSSLLVESLRDTVASYTLTANNTYLQRIVDRFADDKRIVGMAVYDNKDNLVALSTGLDTEFAKQTPLGATVMDANQPSGTTTIYQNKKVYLYATPLFDDQKNVIGALMIVQNADYIDQQIVNIWRTNMMRLLVQIVLISIAIAIFLYWLIYKPIRALIEGVKDARLGRKNNNHVNKHIFFQPLINEFLYLNKSLQQARHIASQEARMRQEAADSPWTKERLKEFVKDTLKNRKIVVVSNREPYIHNHKGNSIEVVQPASGVVTALDSFMQACGGLWVAQASGTADKETVDKNDKIMVPPNNPSFTLKRIWLTKEEEKGYYLGLANRGLWPLIHMAHVKPIFNNTDWEEYKKVNGKFAEAILQEIKNIHKPLIFIQDLHFGLLPRIIKKSRPDATISLFWHEPWPNPEVFRIYPWRVEFLEGMLGADLLGFHTQLHCNNFINTVANELEALIDLEQFAIQKDGHTTYVKPFPVSIPYKEKANAEEAKAFDLKQRDIFLREFDINPTELIGVGVERLDYIKGLLEKFRAIDVFFEKHPEFKQRFTYIELAPTSKPGVQTYDKFAEDAKAEIKRINDKHETRQWKPIVLINKHQEKDVIEKLYLSANVCVVTSLHDGMNLVAKEYAAARTDEKGVLILSQFAGASKELKEAIIVNPYNTDQLAEAIYTALTMMQSEQTKRMRKLRETIEHYNVYRWSADIIKSLLAIES